MAVILDEVTFIIRLLSDNWSATSTSLHSANKIHSAVPAPKFIDVRSVEPKSGRRVDVDSGAVVIVYEDSSSTEHPTIDHAIRNETFNFTIHARVLYRRDLENSDNSATQFNTGVSGQPTMVNASGSAVTYLPVKTTGRDRIQSIYRIIRHILENNYLRPTVTTTTTIDGVTTTYRESAETLKITGRSEANDRGKKLLGYKLSVELKRHGRSVT